MQKKDNLAVTDIYAYRKGKTLKIPLFLDPISAGFPSPAEDYIDKKLDLNQLVISHPAATFFVRVQGNSMIDAGIHSGDILVVDRSIEPGDRKIVIAVIDGDLLVKRLRKTDGKLVLESENPSYEVININPEMQFQVWGTVTYVIHRME